MKRRTLLAVLPALAAAPEPQLPLLNHFYATVDAQTYAAIEASSFLREQFAPFEQRTTVRNDSTYSGLYLYGTSVYFEFFEAGKGDRKAGDAGFALGLENSTGSGTLRAKWQKLRPSLTSMVTRQLDGQPIDWFLLTSFEETRAVSVVDGLRVFAMQYAPGFVKRWNPASRNSILQRDILAAYCERLKLSKLRRSSLLNDADRIEISGPAAGHRIRAQQLEAVGWKVEYNADSILCTGPNATVLLRATPQIIGVTAIHFSLKKQPKPSTLKIGSTTLQLLPNRRALWTLQP